LEGGSKAQKHGFAQGANTSKTDPASDNYYFNDEIFSVYFQIENK
jgi:hypothetical protein